jgi:acetyl esterase/lipase
MSLEELRQEPVTFQLDVSYATTGNPKQRLDLYLPKNRKRDHLPVIVFFHGGGWEYGEKSDGAARLLPFVRSGEYAGVSVGYRLTGEAQWPAQIHDTKAGVRWIRANARKYGLDADRIAVWGRSAGGHLALMLGVTGDVPELEGEVGPYRRVSSSVTAVVNIYGITEMLAIMPQPNDVELAQLDAFQAKLIGGAVRENPQKAKAASPVTYVTANDAPVLTVHGTDDGVVPYDQAVRLDRALQKAGVPSYLVTVRGGRHEEFGTAVDRRVNAFFAKYLLGKRVEVSKATVDPPER